MRKQKYLEYFKIMKISFVLLLLIITIVEILKISLTLHIFHILTIFSVVIIPIETPSAWWQPLLALQGCEGGAPLWGQDRTAMSDAPDLSGSVRGAGMRLN